MAEQSYQPGSISHDGADDISDQEPIITVFTVDGPSPNGT